MSNEPTILHEQADDDTGTPWGLVNHLSYVAANAVHEAPDRTLRHELAHLVQEVVVRRGVAYLREHPELTERDGLA